MKKIFGNEAVIGPARRGLERPASPRRAGATGIRAPAIAASLVVTASLALLLAPTGLVAQNGSGLDPSFSEDGWNWLGLDHDVAANAVAVDGDGRVVIAGTYRTGNGDHWLVGRLLPNGTPDASFDGDGYRVESLRSCAGDACDIDGPALALAIDDQRRLIVGGASGSAWLIGRYTAAGVPDATFGDGGFVSGSYDSSYGSAVHGLALLPDNRIAAVVGTVLGGDVATSTYGLIRLTAAGAPDTGFGTNGRHDEIHQPAQPTALLRQPDGMLVVLGTHDFGSSPGSTAQCVVARYLANAPAGQAADTGFGSQGVAAFSFDRADQYNSCLALARQPDGMLLVAGWNNERLAVGRLTATGALDGAFDGDGRRILRAPGTGESYQAAGVAVDAAGRVVVAGTYFQEFGGSWLLVARLLADGQPDPSFGTGGLVRTALAETFQQALNGMAIQVDGRIVAAGWRRPQPSDHSQALVARFLNPGAAATATPSPSATASATASPMPTARATASATASPTPTPSPSATASATASPTPSPTPSPTTAPVPRVRGRVLLERRASNAGAEVCLGLRCVATGADGTFALEGATAGATLAVRHPSYLMTTRTLPPAPPTELVLPPVTLVAGDLNQDGKVEVDDAAMIGQRLNVRHDPARPDPLWLAACDITDDGVIDIRDMVGVQYNLRKAAPSPWP